MNLDIDKIKKAKIVLDKMANGINPVDGTSITEDSFLNDPRIIRCLFFVNEILQRTIDGDLQDKGLDRKKLPFIITAEEKARVQFPEEEIGVNTFAQCINKVINPNVSKKLTGLELNKGLKRMGILGELVDSEGKKKTIVPESSEKYGIHTLLVNYNGTEYDKVVFDNKAVRYLLENLESIIGHEH